MIDTNASNAYVCVWKKFLTLFLLPKIVKYLNQTQNVILVLYWSHKPLYAGQKTCLSVSI